MVGNSMREDCVMFSVTGGQAYAFECPACHPGDELVPTEYTFGDCKMILDTCVDTSCVIKNGACPGTTAPGVTNCSSVATFCFGGTTYVSCDVCTSSYNRALKETITVDGCDNVLNLYQCNKGFVPADPCANCTTDSQWTFVPGGSSIDSGAYKRVYRECKKTSMGIDYCAAETKWSCRSGYYGVLVDAGDDSFSGSCTRCPQPDGQIADMIETVRPIPKKKCPPEIEGAEEGIIAGGGSAYIHAAKQVSKLVADLEGDEKTGANVVLKALEAPLFRIAANAGLEGSVIINKVYESEPGIGFDALSEQYVDMVESGILDPAKVTRSALQNATSVASTLLTTESAVANIKEETPAAPAGGGMGMM